MAESEPATGAPDESNETIAEPESDTNMPSKEAMKDDSSEPVKKEAAATTAVREKKEAAKVAAAEVEVENVEGKQVKLLLGILLLALACAFVQESNILNGGDPQVWWASLWAKHKVMPPMQPDNVCTIQFCQSWGTNGLYQQINQMITTRANRDLSVVPAGYPAPPLQQFLAAMVGTFQMLLIINVFLNERLMPEYIRENKMASVFGIFLVLNMVANGLTKTNAFEIYVGKDLVWSTLRHQRMPDMVGLTKGFAKVGVKFN